ncbi:hypothetical protein THAR02_06412 [Trichoderma harzianum]|uniref:Glucose-methanol-choline oxidoreductase N-terminal domain-containing protein n=1 Tax=Trichoderma harzianum TaxID=5544 RepID=A0A0F9XMJ0_TRIHA|nr:hypothetical protein THAR02_06412 [Trichoderma harzianum]
MLVLALNPLRCLKFPITDFATQETIISAGAIDSPKILLLSGIGPQDKLTSHSIPVTSVLPGVGNNFKDKRMVYIKAHLQSGTVPSISMSGVARWQQLGEEDRMGPVGVEPCRIAMRYFKLDNLETFAEFQQLDEQAKQLLMRPWASLYEIAPVTPVIQLNYPQNPYDRRVLVESTNKVIDFIYNSKISVVEFILGLKSKTDEDGLVHSTL